MFVLRCLGSVLKVEQDSEIIISAQGVKVTALAELKAHGAAPLSAAVPSVKDPMLDRISHAVGEAAEEILQKSAGKPIDPNSLRQQVLRMCSELHAKGVQWDAIRRAVKDRFADKAAHYQYIYEWRKQHKAA